MVLIRDLIDLPQFVSRADFVLKLSEGIERSQETLDKYVITPQLADCFDQALHLIRGALAEQASKGAYLHGSFGSGKSHFMAVLNLLLKGNVAARSRPELTEVVARHSDWLQGRKLLQVPFHMIDAPSLEARIFGGYVEYVQKNHPEAALPGIYHGERIFHDAQQHRLRLGDRQFFNALNETAGAGDSGWGELADRWDPESYEFACAQPPNHELRSRLVARLVQVFFPSYGEVVKQNQEAFVGIDDGLSIISRHAKSLGYDGLVLFLDELILWLASHAADKHFLTQEGPKVAKLVESEQPDRPAPIISFIARQRDLAELVNATFTGNESFHFTSCLNWWEARFVTITLEDRNLAAIAEKRILRPRSEGARQEIDRAFVETTKARQEVLDTLLTSTGTREQFRQVYPFSPALVETLVDLSSLLQRERTALKVMLQLLVEQRDTLELGQIVPVGDLFDAMAEGDEPFTDVMRSRFETARRLYSDKLRPILEQQAGVTFEEAGQLPFQDPEAANLRMLDRLVKTLLLSALAPNVESLRNLTAGKLAALHHQSIKAPIEGREAQVVLKHCQEWASATGQIQFIGDEANPVISIELTGVDIDPILERFRSCDNPGNRQQKIRELLFEQLKIEEKKGQNWVREHLWRGTWRTFEVVFANVREMADETLRSPDEGWKILIDFPFDEPSCGPRDDTTRLATFKEENPAGSRTVAWIPSFLSLDLQRDLGTLVIIDHVLTGDRFASAAASYSPADRPAAQMMLEVRRESTRKKLIQALEAAYGLNAFAGAALAEGQRLDEHFVSLTPELPLLPVVGPSFEFAFSQLLDQLLDFQFSDHPRFSNDCRPTLTNLQKIHLEIRRAINEPTGRIPIDKSQRELIARLAIPLKFGSIGETHFVVEHFWEQHFFRKQAENGGPLTVGRLRKWLDDPQPRGLLPECANLVILVFAEQANRELRLYGAHFEGKLGDLPDDVELKEQPLPTDAEWDAAVDRGGKILGAVGAQTRNTRTLHELGAQAQAVANAHRGSCSKLVRRLQEIEARWLPDATPSARLRTAMATQALVERVSNLEPLPLVQALAGATIATSAEAMARSLKTADAILEALDRTNWPLLEGLAGSGETPGPGVAGLLDDLRQALAEDEYVVGLAPSLSEIQAKATQLLLENKAPAPPVVAAPPAPPVIDVVIADGQPGPPQGSRRVSGRRAAESVLEEIRRGLPSTEDFDLELTWKVVPKKGDAR